MRKLKNEQLGRLSLERFKESKKTPLLVVLDNVRSLNNVGSIFRTCDAFAIEKVYLCGITPAPPHREIQKTALGATETILWEKVDSTLSLIKELKEENIQTIAVEQVENSTMLQNFKSENKKMALVFGNEIYGVSQEVVYACDLVLEIPQFGTKHSLNVAVSTGVVIWEAFRQLLQG